ncbi:hypothetical protein MAR_015870 [Mya arenaria]|uniref:Uncharacterized protein n=1 Tax=Mya arenaria TaxID=6604 RepID=A0ABY7FRQ6_MYAAR|nr:hypothetical protein MAR_015870 [Mya arenaria]
MDNKLEIDTNDMYIERSHKMGDVYRRDPKRPMVRFRTPFFTDVYNPVTGTNSDVVPEVSSLKIVASVPIYEDTIRLTLPETLKRACLGSDFTMGCLRLTSVRRQCQSDQHGDSLQQRDQTGRKLGKWLSTNSPSAWLIRGATALNITAQSGVLC